MLLANAKISVKFFLSIYGFSDIDFPGKCLGVFPETSFFYFLVVEVDRNILVIFCKWRSR